MSADERDSTRYLRLVSFFIDVGTEIVYKVFLYFIPGPDKNVEAFLTSEHAKDTLRKLNRGKVLKDREFNFVTRPYPNAEKFDISLLITLLSNLFTGHLAPPANGWKTNMPGQNDVSVAADLLRLRKLRNNIVGHHSRASISEGNFDKYWKQLEDIFTRTCKVIDPCNELEIDVKIEDYKTRNLDPENIRLIRENLEELTTICEDVIKKQEQVEQLMEKQNEFFQFFRKRPERFLRYTELLHEGGQFVLAEHLQKELLKHGELLRTLLEEKMDILTQELGEEAMIMQLKDEPGKWDVFVLAVVLLTLFGGEMNRIEQKLVAEILEALKDYANNAILSLDSDKFSSPCENLVHCLKTLSYSLGEDVEAKIDEYIKKYKTQTRESITDDSFLEKLKVYGKNTKTLASIYEETLKQLKEAMKVMEESGITFKNDHVFQLKMITLGEDSEKKKLAEDILSTVWKAALDGSENPGEFKQVRQEIDNILEEIRKRGGQTGNLERSCIFITIRCASSDNVIKVLEYFESTLFQEQFYNLSNELSAVCSCVVAVSARVTLESLNTALINSTGREDESVTEGLGLAVVCGSAEDMHEVLRLSTADTTTNSFNKISEELSHLLQDKISVKLYPDLQRFSGVFEDTDTSTSDSPRDEPEMDETAYYTASVQNDQNEYQELFDKMEGMTLEEKGHWIDIEEPCTASVGLKQALINDYKKNYTSLSVSPYLENMTLDELYVPPYPLQAIDNLRPEPVFSFREILINGKTVFNDIYVTAPTGYGKTAYIQWLTQCWCQAHEIQPTLSSRFEVSSEIKDKDVEMMKDFEYLFTISLSKLEIHSLKTTHIIKEHVKRNIGTHPELLNEIDFALLNQKCLVLFNGLDEVLSYGESDDKIDRDVGDNCTIVTTTTIWAFEQMANDYSGRTYRRITLGKMSKELNELISEKIIMFFKERTVQTTKYKDPFSRVLQGNQDIKQLLDVARSLELEKFLEYPIMLSHIVGIYVEGKLADINKPDLYSSLVDLLTIRAEEKLAVRRTLAKFKRESPCNRIIPNLTLNMEYIDLFEKIGELAFNLLFDKSYPLFSFNETEADRFITSGEGSITASSVLEAGLKLGLLVKQSDDENLNDDISFIDVTFQSFFAAIYIACHNKKEKVCNAVYQRLRSSADVCLISDVCIFLCAFYPEGGLGLVQKCQIVVSNDETVKAYRESIEDKHAEQIKQIQDMVIWTKEVHAKGVTDASLNDCIVNNSCKANSYRSALKTTIQRSKTSMLSLRIDSLTSVEADDEVSPFLQDLLERGLENLQKLRIADSVYFRKIDFVKFGSLRIVCLENLGKNDKELLYQMFGECNLEGFGLVKAKMNHDGFNTILDCVANKKTIKQLVFDTIICVEHRDECNGFVIELNGHSNLQVLTLVDIPVSQIKVDLSTLEELRIGSLNEKTEHDILVHDNMKMKISSFTCLDLSLGSEIGPFLERLPNLIKLDLELIDFQCLKQIPLPSLSKYLKTIRLFDISLNAETVKILVDGLKKVKRCVTFDMVYCKVKPLENFERIIVDVKHWPRFTECVADNTIGSLFFKTKGGKQVI